MDPAPDNRGKPPESITGPDRPMNERHVVIIPEFHGRSTFDFAKELFVDIRETRPEEVARLFTEGYSNKDTERAAQEEGLPVIGINLVEAARINPHVSFAFACVRFANVAGAVSSKSYPDRDNILNNANEEARLYFAGMKQPMPSDPILAMQNYIIAEVRHAATNVNLYTKLDAKKIVSGMEAMPSTKSGHMPADLKGVVLEAYGQIGQKELKEFNTEVRKAAEFFDIKYQQVKFDQINSVKRKITKPDLPEAMKELRQLLGHVRHGRELAMAYFIAREKFDSAVVNCGYKHANSEFIHKLLESKGITLSVMEPS